jgi:hypothetical protein
VKIRGFAKKVWEGDGESVGFIRVFLKKNWNLGHRVIASQEHVFEIFGFGFGSVGGGRATEQDEWSLPPPEFLS